MTQKFMLKKTLAITSADLLFAFRLLSVIIGSSFFIPHAMAEKPTVQHTLKIENHLFFPDVLYFPKNTPVKLLVVNLDQSAEEFESHELNKEKIIPGGAKSIIYFGPLSPGEYSFFGEFNPITAKGKIVVE